MEASAAAADARRGPSLGPTLRTTPLATCGPHRSTSVMGVRCRLRGRASITRLGRARARARAHGRSPATRWPGAAPPILGAMNARESLPHTPVQRSPVQHAVQMACLPRANARNGIQPNVVTTTRRIPCNQESAEPPPMQSHARNGQRRAMCAMASGASNSLRLQPTPARHRSRGGRWPTPKAVDRRSARAWALRAQTFVEASCLLHGRVQKLAYLRPQVWPTFCRLQIRWMPVTELKNHKHVRAYFGHYNSLGTAFARSASSNSSIVDARRIGHVDVFRRLTDRKWHGQSNNPIARHTSEHPTGASMVAHKRRGVFATESHLTRVQKARLRSVQTC